MKSKAILHLSPDNKFIPDLIDLLNKNIFEIKNIFILYFRKDQNKNLTIKKNTRHLLSVWDWLRLVIDLYRHDKIFIHGLWSYEMILLLANFPFIQSKLYWLMHGGDFYNYSKAGKMKRKLIRRIKNFVTFIPGDIDYIKEHYGAEGKYHDCIGYPSNVFKSKNGIINNTTPDLLTILVGNSADPTNNHNYIFQRILDSRLKIKEVICPLSYGDDEYKKKVLKQGYREFGPKFRPLLKFIDLDEYYTMLESVDLVLFAHKRQQALGNTIQLLGMGKTVYIDASTTTWNMCKKLEIEVRDIQNDNLRLNRQSESEKNMKIIISNFSEEALIDQYKCLLNS